MISIIIPAYNNPKQLKKALESISKQTYKDFEVIVVDDGSDQPMADKIQDTRYKIQNLKVFRINHSGANKARNYGFLQSKGEYVIFWDADLVGKPNMLRYMIKTLKSDPSASWAYSSFKYGLKSFKLWPYSIDRLKKMPCIHTTSLIRREHFPASGWDESIKRLQDWDLWLTMMEQGYYGIFILKFLFKVQAKGTMSAWLPMNMKVSQLLYKKPFKYFLPKSVKRKVKEYEEAVGVIKKKHSLNF